MGAMHNGVRRDEVQRLAMVCIALWKAHPHVRHWYSDDICRLFDSLDQPAAELRHIWGGCFLNAATTIH